MIRSANGYCEAPLPTSRRAVRLAEDAKRRSRRSSTPSSRTAYTSLKDDLRLRGGLLYAERRDNFTLVKTVGDPGLPLAETLDPAVPPLSEVARHRVYIFRDPDAEGSPHRLGLFSRAAVAALLVGQRPHRYVIFLLLADGWQVDELDFSLNTIRASLDARLVDARVRGSFREAAEIQQSLLVEEPPAVRGLRPRRALGGRGRGRGRLLRLRGLRQRDARRLDRRRERARPARRAPRARRGDGPAHGDREGAQGRARLREAEPRHPPLAASPAAS